METQINNIIHIDDGIIAELELTGEQYYEQWMLDNIAKLPYREGAWFDVGAHTGNHSIYFARHCKADQIICFEPTKSTFDILEKNIQKNPTLIPISAFKIAIGSANGYCEVIKDKSPGQNKINVSESGVEVRSLDFIKSGFGKAALIKIDVEGFELEVLKGAKKLIESDLPELFIETFEDPNIILELLPKQYKLIQRYNNAPTYHFSAK